MFGAVCPDRGVGAGLVMPYANRCGRFCRELIYYVNDSAGGGDLASNGLFDVVVGCDLLKPQALAKLIYSVDCSALRPRSDASRDDVLVGFVEPVRELVLAQIFPDVFGGIEFRGVGRGG